MRDKAKKRGGSGEAAGRQRGGSGEAAGSELQREGERKEDNASGFIWRALHAGVREGK